MSCIKMLPNGELVLQHWIISYPHLFTARAAGRPGYTQGTPKYSANFIAPCALDAGPLRWGRSGPWPARCSTRGRTAA